MLEYQGGSMRQLIAKPSGFTLIEVTVVMSIIALLATAAMPPLVNYMTNSRLREAANGVLTLAMWTRSEAIKRNATTTLNLSSGNFQVSTSDGAIPTILRSSPLPNSVKTADFVASFDSSGRMTPFGTQIAVVLSAPNQVCSEDIRCPAVLLDAGGTVSICPTGVCP